MRFAPNAVVGIGIALLGTALLLDRLGIVALGNVLQFWPVLLILFGASVAAQALRGGNGDSGRQRPIVTPGFVLFLVIISFVFSNAYERSSVARSDTSSDRVATFNLLGRDYRASHSTRFRGAEMTNVMGGSTLDLRQAMIAPGEEAVVEVFGLMGKVEVIVPEGWIVEVRAVPVMGRVRDRRWFRSGASDESARSLPESAEAVTPEAAEGTAEAPPDTPQAPTGAPPRIVLRGVMMMGAIEIRS